MKSNQIIRAHELYQCGLSIEKTARRFGTTRQRLHGYFRSMGLPTRPKPQRPRRLYDDRVFTQDKDGYWRATDGDRIHLHKLVWKQAGREMPKRNECLYFINGDRDDCRLQNLALTTISDFTKNKQKQIGNQFFKASKEEIDAIVKEIRDSYTCDELLALKNFEEFFDLEDTRNAYEEEWNERKEELKPVLKHCWKKARLQIAEEFLTDEIPKI